jgi:riboflavin kinase / FMN adenylyltransferase
MNDCAGSLARAAPASRWFAVPEAVVEWSDGAGPAAAPDLALAIGMFDGVHRGHQAVIASAREAAARDGGAVVVLTFCPHPSRVLRPRQPTEMLFREDLKGARLFARGVAGVVWKRFDPTFAGRSAEEFVDMLAVGFPTLRSLHVGENFRFGRGRIGTPEFFAERFAGTAVEVVTIPRLIWEGDAISSTRVRDALRRGAIERVNAMLGEPYSCAGAIVGGKRLGRSIGYPTLNLAYDPECRPRFGVYVVEAVGADGIRVPAVANYGLRPTVEETVEPRLEVHALEDLPESWRIGARLRVEWHAFLRPEERFADLAQLKAQIDLDVGRARDWFGR